MSTAGRLPVELWSRIFRICVLELDNNRPAAVSWPAPGSLSVAPLLRKSATALACVCSSWKDLVLSDHRLAVMRARYDSYTEDLARQSASMTGRTENRIAIQMAIHKPAWYPPEEEGEIHSLLIQFAGRIEVLSIGIYSHGGAEDVFKAFEDTDFKQLYLFEILYPGSRHFSFPDTHIRAPNITTLKLNQVMVLLNADFLRFIAGLPFLQHLHLGRFSNLVEATHIAQHGTPLVDSMRTELKNLQTLNLEDPACSTFVMLQYLILPNMKELKLWLLDWFAIPDERCYHYPGFDFPKLSRLYLSVLNLCTTRLLRFAHLPALSQLMIERNSNNPVDRLSGNTQQGTLEILAPPNLRHLSIGILLTSGECPLKEFLSVCCTAFLTSLCLTPFANYHAPLDEPINLPPDSFAAVRSLTIHIQPAMLNEFDGRHFDSICAILSGVVDLQVSFRFLHLKDARRMQFLCPSRLLVDVDGRQQMQILPNLQELSLLAQVEEYSSPDWRINESNCTEVNGYVRARSSIVRRLRSVVFNRPIAPRALASLQKYVDQVSVDRKAWEKVHALLGEKHS